ncbi:MAG TPA: two-component regulator propeller domain-containing protein [Flavilitoribacter sp.]|nr:two-component regulator propeller domain-containing protein [Flavilitoribacter sp.]HMQ90432.1 two-component regulator propeller domain-containing protein [Flavilitoribacter sp.]
MKHTIPNWVLLSGIILFNSFPLPGQFDQLAFQKLKSDRPEFSLISILAIHQDKDGFIWFGTDQGLYRYDGHGFKVYQENPLDPKSLPDNTIFVLKEDLDGNLWVGSQNAGIFKYASQKDEFTLYTRGDSPKGGLSDNQITDILVSKDGEVWAGTRNGLNCWDKKRDKFFQIDIQSENPNIRISNSIRQIEQDQKGRIWVGTGESGLGYLDPDTKKFVQLPFSTTPPDSTIYATISSLITDYNGDIWTSTEDGGLFRIKLETGQIDFYQMWPPGDDAP